MKLNLTFSRYIAWVYLRDTLFLLCALMGIIYLFDTVELIRRASKVDDVPFMLVLQMGLLKLPEVVQILFPFAILFGAMLSFWTLNRRQELVVLRSAGLSVWQFIAPVVITAFVIGVLQITVFNPFGALLLGKFERMESDYLRKEARQIAVFKEGLWLRQDVDLNADFPKAQVDVQGVDGEEGLEGGDSDVSQSQAEREQGYVILHAAKVELPTWRLKRVKVLFFDEEDQFIRRIDAPYAFLKPGYWLFEDAVLYDGAGAGQQFSQYRMATDLTIADVEDSFSSPSTMSFWKLKGYIRTLEETGFDASSLRVHYQSLLSQPLFFISMILLAASVAMRPPRQGSGLMLFAIGIFVGFVIFFVSSFLQALGASQQIPVLLAAWAPSLICLMFGVSVVIHLEDG